MFEKHLFTQYLDKDSEDRVIEQGAYRYALNIQHYEMGIIQNAMGNTLVSYILPSGTNKVIGALDDIANNKIYYCVYNSNANHLVLEYNALSNTVFLLSQSSFWNFNTEYLITGMNVLGGDLYFTDDLNPPRSINIDKARSNNYPTPFIEEFIDAIKYAPNFHPTTGYANDTTKNVNLVQNKIYQFKYQFVYDDYKKSTWSPISQQPLPIIVCGDNQNPTINNNIKITVKTGSGICERIKIAARLGNTGDFFEIADLSKSDLSIPDNSTYIYSFYNDKNYSDLDVNESNLLFDNLPLVAKAQEVIGEGGSRVAYGNTVDGFDNIKPNCTVNLTYSPEPNLSTYSFSGKIYVRNPFSTNTDYENNQPIWFLNNGTYIFGGFAPADVENDVATDYNQTIPLAGFVAYLSGTDYYGVSKQVIKSTSQSMQDSNNVYDGTSGNKRNKIRNEITSSNCYSTFTINGVPPGDYVLRFASHLTVQSDLSASSRGYQTTSTYAYKVAGSNDFEARIEVSSTGVIKVNGTIVSASNIGDSYIADLSDGRALFGSTGIAGYVTDADVQPTPTTTSGLLNDTRVTKAVIQFNQSLPTYNAEVLTGTSKLNMWLNGKAKTDHNGFFFFSGLNTILTGSLNISNVKMAGTTVSSITKYNYDASSFTPPTSAKVQYAIVRNSIPGSWDSFRTILEGTVTNGSQGISNISVIVGHGAWEKTDLYGDFSIVTYFDGELFYQRKDRIYFAINGDCLATFATSLLATSDYFDIAGSNTGNPTGQQLFSSPYSGEYDYTTTCLIADVTALISGGIGADLSWARAGNYQLGLVYYNKPNQSSTTQTDEATMKVYVPYYTELDTNGLTYGANGKIRPILELEINHQPPDWAYYYQIVRTKNSSVNIRLQFTAKSVVYTDDDRTPTSPSLATKIGLSIQNILDFNTRNTDSQISYDFTEGDRIKLIKDQSNNFFTAYYDLKIRDFDPAGIIYVDAPNNLSITLTAGVLFEVYTPKLQVDTQLFYEFGHVYEIGNPATNTRYHKGGNQDQNTNYTTPAKTTLNGADTYYRIRRMPDSSSTRVRYIEDMSFNDFFPSKVENIGRPNKEDKDARRTRRESTIFYSEKYIPETKINGVNRFFDLNFETYDHSFGSIQKLYYFSQNLETYFELKVGQIPVNKTVYTDLQNGNTVGASPKVLSDSVMYYQGEYGIGKNPESWAYYGAARYFVDIFRGAVLRISNDGITAISEYKMRNYFAQKSKDIITTGKQWDKAKIYGVFDRKNMEYIISFADITTTITVESSGTEETPPTEQEVVVLAGETLSFDEKANLWSTFYSFLPEMMCPNNIDYVTFKNGELWKHNANNTRNNFYGTQYNSEVWLVANGEPSMVKFFKSMTEETNSPTPWIAYGISTSTANENGYFQSSELATGDFERVEGVWYAAFLKDENTPNVSNPITQGDVLRGETMELKLRNYETTSVKMFAVNINWHPSQRTNR